MTVRVERDGPVATVILDRPDVRNAVDGPTAAALARAFRAFDADDGAHVAVLWGAGGTFCSGADLKAVGGPDGNRAEPDGDGPMGPTRLRLAKPVIAAIAGHAVAGGLELALWCDLRVAEEDAVLGVFCRRWGVPLIDGGTVRLPRVVGLGRAMDMILTGRPVAAPEALAMGLADRVVPPGQARPAAEALAHEIATLPQQCLRSDRASALEGGWLGEDEAMANEFRHSMTVLAAPGMADGVDRFRGGRRPGRRSRLKPDRYQTYPPGVAAPPRHFPLRARLRALIWLNTREPPTRRSGNVAAPPFCLCAMAEKCSFCGKRRHQVPGLAAAGSARICAECLELCHEILTERLA